jgi:hypothetical protein
MGWIGIQQHCRHIGCSHFERTRTLAETFSIESEQRISSPCLELPRCFIFTTKLSLIATISNKCRSDGYELQDGRMAGMYCSFTRSGQ